MDRVKWPHLSQSKILCREFVVESVHCQEALISHSEHITHKANRTGITFITSSFFLNHTIFILKGGLLQIIRLYGSVLRDKGDHNLTQFTWWTVYQLKEVPPEPPPYTKIQEGIKTAMRVSNDLCDL